MTSGISENYRELAPEEVETFAERVRNAWQDAAIPERQWNRVVKDELETFRRGGKVRPYDVIISCLRMLPAMELPSLLDVGAASGYYSAVLEIAGFECRYTGLDNSPHFKQFAMQQFPNIQFDVGDACALPYGDTSFDIVLHSACIMHCIEWQDAVAEAARVASKYVIFHRTPLVEDGSTHMFRKQGYDVWMCEIHFNEAEFLQTCHQSGLILINYASMSPMKSYVFTKS